MAEIVVKLLLTTDHFTLNRNDEIADKWWIESPFADSGFDPCERLLDCVTTGARKSQGSEAPICYVEQGLMHPICPVQIPWKPPGQLGNNDELRKLTRGHGYAA
jgi:hypothetical protein